MTIGVPIDIRLIEATARRMCEEMGMEANDYVRLPSTMCRNTHFENRHMPYIIDDTMSIAGRDVKLKGMYDAPYTCPRWEMFRADAEKALATWKAVNATILIDT